MRDPVDHIVRPPLPWRVDAGMTECGLDASKTSTIARSEFADRLKNLGRQRTIMLTCVTCYDTASRWGVWNDDPRDALQREISWEKRSRRGENGQRLKDEMLAIAALVAAHRDEFDALVNANERRRVWIDKKATRTRGASQ